MAPGVVPPQVKGFGLPFVELQKKSHSSVREENELWIEANQKRGRRKRGGDRLNRFFSF